MKIVKMILEEAMKSTPKTNWDELEALLDEEIIEAAKNDPDSALPTDEQLKEFKPVW